MEDRVVKRKGDPRQALASSYFPLRTEYHIITKYYRNTPPPKPNRIRKISNHSITNTSFNNLLPGLPIIRSGWYPSVLCNERSPFTDSLVCEHGRSGIVALRRFPRLAEAGR